MKLPNFLIIGTAKCGTTALWYNLHKHPDITMASKSGTSIEMNFWGSTAYHRGIDWYKSRMVGDFNGEKSTKYYRTSQSMQEIKKHLPDAKLILCVRNPVDRGFSNHQMNTKSKKVSAPFTLNLFKRRYARHAYFMQHLKNCVLPNINRDQLYICIAERMKNDLTNEMNKLFDFLGVSHLDLPPKIVDGRLLKKLTRKEDRALSLTEPFYRVWSKHDKLTDIKLRNECLEYMKPYNEKFFDFLGYKIKEWSK